MSVLRSLTSGRIVRLALFFVSSTAFATQVIVDLAADPATLRVDSDRSADNLGAGVASCDFNNDGLLDVALGAYGGDGEQDLRSNAGEVSIIWGRRGRVAGTTPVANIRSVYVIGQDGFDQLGDRLACGDVNQDGRPDLLAGAETGDGLANNIPNAGQLHIIFGVESWPSTIDLALTPGTVIYGRSSNEAFGAEPEVGDINGDGGVDVVANALQGLNRNNTLEAGRVYVFFGRSAWPPTIDLLVTPADVTIFGRSGTRFSTDVRLGDLDADGTDDLVSSARLGDTPVAGRTDAGDVYLFRGRTSWPATIDLATQAATTRAYGVNAFDYAGHLDGLAIGDIDGSGIADLAIGLPGADGRANAQSFLGETRLIEPGVSWPATIDLAAGTRQIVYGHRAEDTLGDDLYAGDVDGDGTADLLLGSDGHDGFDGTLNMAGAVIVVLGRSAFPTDTDMATSGEDWRIVGAYQDAIRLHGVSDINADGILELVIASKNIAGSPPPNSTWFVSPIDIDGDGYQQLADNCPLVSNADQLDTNSDSIGDACQLDYDGDGADDAVDCSMSNPKLGKPGPIRGVQLSGTSATTISWLPNTAADTYSLLRGLVSELSATDYGACQDFRDANTADTSFIESQAPPPADAYFYLVFGRDAGCGGRGLLGTTSSGVPRVNLDPADCP